jgi:hypothetical protein
MNTRRAIPPRPAQSPKPAQPATSPWPIEGDEAWDRAFRAWAEALLVQYETFGGMISMLIGQVIACAWRLRYVNYYELSTGGMTNRDWMRAHKFAQHAFSRAQIDFTRWARLLLPELRRRAKLGDPSAEPRIAALLNLPPLPPPPELDEVYGDTRESAKDDPSTDTLKSVPTNPPQEAGGAPVEAGAGLGEMPRTTELAFAEPVGWPVLTPA